MSICIHIYIPTYLHTYIPTHIDVYTAYVICAMYACRYMYMTGRHVLLAVCMYMRESRTHTRTDVRESATKKITR